MRVIGADGEQAGVMSVEQAQELAYESDLDLVEIAPDAEPPVCRVMDYGKFRFEENKKLQTAKKKQKQTQVKEIKFRPGTDVGDYRIKLKKLTQLSPAHERMCIEVCRAAAAKPGTSDHVVGALLRYAQLHYMYERGAFWEPQLASMR